MGLELETLEIGIVVLLLIISAVAIGIRSLRVPYPIALVMTGLAVGVLLRGPLPVLRDLELEQVQLTPDLILFLLLPALLFEATLHIEVGALRKTSVPIGLLAIPGVVLFTLIVQGLTMEPLLKRLKLVGAELRWMAYEARRAQLMMLQVARRELQRMAREAVLSSRVV